MARKKPVPLPWQNARDQSVRDALAARFAGPPKKPLTARHLQYLKALDEKAVVLGVGPAGTAKTALACQAAADQFKAGRVRRIVLTRPVLECDEELGFLPGSLAEKMAPFVAPMVGWLRTHFPADLDQLVADGRVEVVPLAYMRGLTFDDAFVVLDEAQGATYRQLKMLLTRVGHNCRVAVTADLRQSDLVDRPRDVPLLRVLRQLGAEPRHPDVALVKFGPADVLRSGLVQFVDDRLTG